MERAVPHLPGDDLQRAREFYINQLGFDVALEASEDGRTGILGICRGSLAILIDCPMPGHGRDACVTLEVDSTDQYYREWSARVPVQRPSQHESWGARTFGLLDPFGNTLFVAGPLA